MNGKTLLIAATPLLSVPLLASAQTNPGGAHAAQGVTSGPAVGSPAGMKSPQAGPVATKHQRQVLHDHDRSVPNNSGQAAAHHRNQTESVGSSSPTSAPATR
jgi:hypothetical protein